MNIKYTAMIMLTLILIAHASAACAQSAREAYRAMKKLELTVNNNMLRLEYDRVYRDTELEVTLYINDKSTNGGNQLKTKLREAWENFEVMNMMLKLEGDFSSYFKTAQHKLDEAGNLMNQRPPSK